MAGRAAERQAGCVLYRGRYFGAADMTWGTVLEIERGMWADPNEKARLLKRIADLEAEVRRLQSPSLEEYRRRYEKDFPDG